MPLDPERRGEVVGAKLRALVAGRWGPAADDGARRATTFPAGAGLVDAANGRGWVLPDANAARALGPAFVWAERHAVTELHVLVDDADVAAALARRAAAFTLDATVWTVAGRELVRADPAPPPALDPPLPDAARRFTALIEAAGADAVVERGVLVGEVDGLEVARVVVDGEGAYLEVGVGKHDRHAQTLLHGDRPSEAALATAVEFVARHRRLDAEPHPLNRLARERWLRARVLDSPALVGAAQLRPVSSPVERDDLRVAAPAPAVGLDTDAEPIVVVCSTGIDLDLVPAAADVRAAHAHADTPDARLVLVIPTRDDHPVTRRLAQALRDPAEIRTVDL